MAITVQVQGAEGYDEYQDALVLKQQFDQDFKNVPITGEILIISNATLFGQSTKDIDLIVLGTFEKFSKRIKTKASGTNKEELEFTDRWVYINDFCFVIETKRHNASNLQRNGLQLLVRYNDKLHDVTSQSENQKFALKSFLKERIKMTPFICNFIWLRNVSLRSINELVEQGSSAEMKHNYLPSTFDFTFLMQLACVQHRPFTAKIADGQYKGYCSFNCLPRGEAFDMQRMSDVFDVFRRIRQGTGDLTRKKMEQITQKLLGDQQWVQAIGEKLVVLSGRAGTGKTMKLLRIACDLANNRGARCLILTFNHALVGDIKRTLALAEIPDKADSYSVGIMTLHKFVYELVIGFGLVDLSKSQNGNPLFVPNYLKEYRSYLIDLCDHIENGLIEDREIQDLMLRNHDKVAWDYILIDEAQDWDDLEKKLIFRLFGRNKTIVADGVDQLVRSQQKCNWTLGLREVDFKKTHEKRGLRQEFNLVSFVNAYANHAGVSWEVEPKQELLGGRVIISSSGYTKDLHERELKKVKDSGNSEYELLFLVPPALVERKYSTDNFGNSTVSRRFVLTDGFRKMGIDTWDGTNTDLRTEYPVDLKQHRLLQYESCRGLEGWTVVCLDFDDFVQWKFETFKDEVVPGELALESFEEKRRRFVYLWSLIPLTRAIDTLIIILRNPHSEVGQILQRTYNANRDFVHWIH